MTYEELQRAYMGGDYCMLMDFEEFCSRYGAGTNMMPEVIERSCQNAICTYDELMMKYAAKCKAYDELKKKFDNLVNSQVGENNYGFV